MRQYHSARFRQHHYVVLSNTEVARKLLEIRTLMELAGESYYKYMAYEKAAASVENAPPLVGLVAVGRTSEAAGRRKVDRRGRRTARPHRNGRSARRALSALPADDLGSSRRQRHRYEDGGDALRGVRHRVARGPRSRHRGRIRLPACRAWGARRSRTGSAEFSRIKGGSSARRCRKRSAIAQEIMAYVREGPPLERLTFAGSLRRAEVTVGDIDLVCTSHEAAAVVAHFCRWERARGRACGRADEGEHLAPQRIADRLARVARSSLRQSAAAFHGLARAQHQASRVRRSQELAGQRKRHSESREWRGSQHARPKRKCTPRSACSTSRPSCAAAATRSSSRCAVRFRP